jgi:type IV secretory pathway TraG/TraD family ATPase VirD4
MTPDELRTLADNQMLLLGSSSAPMILTTKLYFEDPKMLKLVNLPFTPVRIYQEPEDLPYTPHSLPTLPKTQPQVESDLDKNASQDQTTVIFPDDV